MSNAGVGKLTFEGIFGFADAQVARLLEGGDGFADAGDGEFVGTDVEAVYRLVDELQC